MELSVIEGHFLTNLYTLNMRKENATCVQLQTPIDMSFLPVVFVT